MAISTSLKTEAWSVDGDLPIVVLTIDHTDLASPIRVVNDREDVVSGGDTYTAFPFEVFLPDDREDSPPRARLRIDNVSREIGQAIRNISSAATVTLSVVRRADPSTVELTFPSMRLTNVRYNALSVEGDLEMEDLTRSAYPALIFSPADFPGLVQ